MAGEQGGQVSTPVNATPVLPPSSPVNQKKLTPHIPVDAAKRPQPQAGENQSGAQNRANTGGQQGVQKANQKNVPARPNNTASRGEKPQPKNKTPHNKTPHNKTPHNNAQHNQAQHNKGANRKNVAATQAAKNKADGNQRPAAVNPAAATATDAGNELREFPLPPQTTAPVVHKQEPDPDGGNEVFNRIITRRLSRFRSVAWEDDLCRNTLDTAPFENQPPIAGRDMSEFSLRDRQVSDELLAGRDFETMIARDTYPIPSADDREGYSPGRDVNYWLSGLADHLKIMDMAGDLGVNIRSYFDFGCATGRVIRHFCAQTDIPRIWGSDLNARHIRWITEHLPMNVRAIANHAVPTLPIPDNSIDCISAFSVFTHIDTFEGCWLAELSRILSPGGFAYLTVHNEATWNVLRNEIDNPNNRLVQSMRSIDPDTDQKLMGRMPDTRTVYRFTDFGPYRAQVFHSNKYIHQQWGRFFQVHAILNNHHVRQTVVVLRKK